MALRHLLQPRGSVRTANTEKAIWKAGPRDIKANVGRQAPPQVSKAAEILAAHPPCLSLVVKPSSA